MSSGFIYILLNQALHGDMLKVGMSRRSAQDRADELTRSSGAPLPYLVAYEQEVSDPAAAEKMLHAVLAQFRVTNNREFFRLPLAKAVRVLETVASKYAAGEQLEITQTPLPKVPRFAVATTSGILIDERLVESIDIRFPSFGSISNVRDAILLKDGTVFIEIHSEDGNNSRVLRLRPGATTWMNSELSEIERRAIREHLKAAGGLLLETLPGTPINTDDKIEFLFFDEPILRKMKDDVARRHGFGATVVLRCAATRLDLLDVSVPRFQELD